MALPYLFANVTAATGPQLDADFAAVGALTVIPCTVAGTNSLTLTPAANTPTINVYANYLRLSGIAAATNTAATSARYGALGLLNVYKDTAAGPVALAGGEIVQNCAFTLIYDSALNSGAGGWHLVSTPLSAFGGSVSGSLSAPTITATVISAASVAGSSLVSAGTLSGSLLNLGNATLTKILSTAATVSFTVAPTQTAQDQSVALANAALLDQIIVGVTAVPSGAAFSAYVPATGTVNLRLLNASAASIAAFSVVARLTALRTV